MIIDKIKALDHLTIQEKYLVDYILDNPDDILQKNINELAQLSYTSTATVSRLCKKLGFKGYKDFNKGVKDGGIIVIDPNLVHPAQDDFKKWKIYKIPILTIAKDEVGNVATQSVIALAIAAFMSECIDLEKLRTVMLETVPPKTKEANAKAFDLGVKYAKEAVAS